jgi:deoxyribodipyrimidine photolyase-like uncharacterized protein
MRGIYWVKKMPEYATMNFFYNEEKITHLILTGKRPR